ncbi:hypothetical protein XENOCAPTIV_009471 [Xenoophorus captivus]|uniref:Uncharacterized protein n=1 Tax=Xenoophorus captivus TaxID=1517983 RepID=A0ABV0QQW6_9TELE
MEMANLLLDWLEVWGGFFPQSALTPGLVEIERQRTVTEIGTLFDLIPGGRDAVDRLPPFLAPVPAPEELVIEPPLLLVPIPAPKELKVEPPPLLVSVTKAVPEGFEDELPSLTDPYPVPGPDPERSVGEPP